MNIWVVIANMTSNLQATGLDLNFWARMYTGFALCIMAGGLMIIVFGIFVIATAQPKKKEVGVEVSKSHFL
jgi:hypothetical protein